jgi:Initiator Replication protein
LARVKEASPRVRFPETGQYSAPEPVCFAAVCSGEKARHGWKEVLGLESVKDAEGNVIQEAPLPIWANFRQRALDIAMLEINKKTDLYIEVESLERSKHRRVTSVTFSIKEQAVP